MAIPEINLNKSIQDLMAEYTDRLTILVRQAAVAAVLDALNVTARQAQPVQTPTPAPAHRATRARRVRVSREPALLAMDERQVFGDAERIRKVLEKHPNGARAEEIKKELGKISKSAWLKAVAFSIYEAKTITKAGEKRATVYRLA